MCLGYNPILAALPYFIDGILLLTFSIFFSVTAVVKKWKKAGVKVITFVLLFITVVLLCISYLKLTIVPEC